MRYRCTRKGCGHARSDHDDDQQAYHCMIKDCKCYDYTQKKPKEEILCARESCGHKMGQHPPSTSTYYVGRPGDCAAKGCSCINWIFPIRPAINPEFPGPNATMILGKYSRPTDLGCPPDQLLRACISSIEKVCRHVGIDPVPAVTTAANAIRKALDRILDACPDCQLHIDQGGYDHDGNHLYGCEFQKKLQAKHDAKTAKTS